MSKYQKYTHTLCEELCKEMKCFEEKPSKETLKNIESLTEVIERLQKIEAGNAMRQIAEEYGYDSDVGRFDVWNDYDDGMPRMEMPRGNMPPYAAGSRRRDSRGRYTSQRGGTRMGPYNNMPYDERWPDGYHQDHSRYHDEYYDEPYILRQEDGKPIRQPLMARHDSEHPMKLSDDAYKDWMKHIENFDGSTGSKWTREETNNVAKHIGVEFKGFTESDFCATMNMLYSDYGETLEHYGVGKPEVYGCLARDFLVDDDFQGNGTEKLALYYYDIVKH